MQVIHDPEKIIVAPPGAVVTIGAFDGVHCGHRKIIEAVINHAGRVAGNSVVITFHPHPLRVLDPARAPAVITPLKRKLKLIETLGVDYCLVITFNRDFARIEPEAFVRDYLHNLLQVIAIYVGFNYAFGSGRKGNVSFLKELAEKYHFSVQEVSALRIHGQPVSSTRIRQLIKAGELDQAADFLGRNYCLAGEVVTGEKRGKHIGYPTANIKPESEVIPPSGVYAGFAVLEEKQYPALLNIGYRPTFLARETESVSQKEQLSLETHLLDFSDNIYGKNIEFIFVIKIRNEKQFPDHESLVLQIRKDEEKARQLLSSKK